MLIKRTLVSIGAVVAAVAMMLPAEALPTFSTTTKSAPDPSTRVTQLWNLRTGNDGTFDRIVFDERVSTSGYSVRYVSRVLYDASGAVVPLRGRYFLRVVISGATTASLPGLRSVMPAVLTPGLPEIAQVRKAGGFEQVVSYGIGLNRYRGFRVFRLTSPSRLVIDVLH
jgi:hypothetical protein